MNDHRRERLLEFPQTARFVFPTKRGEVLIAARRKYDALVKLEEGNDGIFTIDIFDSVIEDRGAAQIDRFGFVNCLEGFVKAMLVLRAYGFAASVPRGCLKYARYLLDGKWFVEDPIDELFE